MKIIGAGLAGLLAGRFFPQAEIYEAQRALPHNHEAILRFRTNALEGFGVPLEKVYVRKFAMANNTFVDKPNPYICNMYSQKVTGEVSSRSIWDLEPGHRWVGPANMTEILARGLSITFNHSVGGIKQISDREPVISTIPMPILMDMVGWTDKPKFGFSSIWVISGYIDKVDVHQTIYYTDADVPYYRASLVGNRLIIEFITNPTEENHPMFIDRVLDDFGINGRVFNIKVTQQKFGKIVPIDDGLRKEFIYSMTREHNIYSLGRFATWRQILVDDVISDLKVIKSIMSGEERSRLYRQKIISSVH